MHPSKGQRSLEIWRSPSGLLTAGVGWKLQGLLASRSFQEQAGAVAQQLSSQAALAQMLEARGEILKWGLEVAAGRFAELGSVRGC